MLLLSGPTAAGASRTLTVSFGGQKAINPTAHRVNLTADCEDEGEACLQVSVASNCFPFAWNSTASTPVVC